MDLVKLTDREYIDVRFIELMPIGEAIKYESEHFLSNQMVLEKVPQLIEVEKEDISSPAVYYKLPNGKGKVGLINPVSCKFCAHCNRVRLTAQGKLKLCLHSNDEIDLKDPLRKGGQDIEKIIVDAIKLKPESHRLESGEYISKKNVSNRRVNMDFTHFNEEGRAHMVEVGHKEDTRRVAVATGKIYMKEKTISLIKDGLIDKGGMFSL